MHNQERTPIPRGRLGMGWMINVPADDGIARRAASPWRGCTIGHSNGGPSLGLRNPADPGACA